MAQPQPQQREGTPGTPNPGPHGGNPANLATSPTFKMRYFYATQNSFYFPGLNVQPPVGTLTPYLRPYVVPGNPASGFAGI